MVLLRLPFRIPEAGGTSADIKATKNSYVRPTL